MTPEDETRERLYTTRAARQARLDQRAERALELEDRMYQMALDPSERSDTRLNAMTRLHAILDGTPIARVITAEVKPPGEIAAGLSPVAAAEAYRRLVEGS